MGKKEGIFKKRKYEGLRGNLIKNERIGGETQPFEESVTV